MKLEKQVCTKEQAKRLKELGVPQQAFFTWYGFFPGSEITPEVDLTDQRNYENSVNGHYGHPDSTCAAFTIAELICMIPVDNDDVMGKMKFDPEERHGKDLTKAFTAECFADILIALLEEKLITPQYCKERLNA